MDRKYVIKNNASDKYIGIDQSSGGYPYDTTAKNAKMFTKKEAKDYKKMFSKEDWSLHTLTINTKPIDW